jgi:hypothetical protein
MNWLWLWLAYLGGWASALALWGLAIRRANRQLKMLRSRRDKRWNDPF